MLSLIYLLYGSVASLPSPSSNIEAWPYGTSLRFASLLHLGHKEYLNIADYVILIIPTKFDARFQLIELMITNFAFLDLITCCFFNLVTNVTFSKMIKQMSLDNSCRLITNVASRQKSALMKLVTSFDRIFSEIVVVLQFLVSRFVFNCA